MLSKPMDILQQFPVRKAGKQKHIFRDAVQEYVKDFGYECKVEQGFFGCRNLIIGDPENARYLVTAHYDTPAAMILPNLITPTNPVSFVLYQLLLVIMLILTPVILSLLLAFGVLLAGAVWLPAEYGHVIVVWSMVVWYAVFFLTFFMEIAMLYFGPANRSNSNDNTSGVVTLLEIARTMPQNQRHKVCFVLFDLEEAGLIGSAAYRKAHKKASDSQIVLNLDCVGEGDHIVMFPTKKLKKDRKKLISLYKACGYFGQKSVTVREKGFSVYPSDQKNFPYGVGICALKPSKFGFYLGRIHTPKDTILEETNVNILRAALTTFICCDAAQ